MFPHVSPVVFKIHWQVCLEHAAQCAALIDALRGADYGLIFTGWVVRWHRLKHPRDIGAAQVEAFLSMLVVAYSARCRKIYCSLYF